MPLALVAGLVVIFLLNLVADRVRDRVDVVRADQRLTVRNQQAALRIDALILTVCVAALVYVVILRSPILILLAAAAVGAVGWRLVKAHRSPAYTFDRGQDLVLRDESSICNLSAVSGLVHVPGERVSSLVLNYRDDQGNPLQELIHRARPPQVTALHSLLADFLAHG